MSFKTYLNEKKYPVRNGMTEWALMIDGKLPLKGTLYDELLFVPKAFRVTSNLAYLVNDQGKKRQTPAFLKGSKGLVGGTGSGNAYLIELEGYTTLHLPQDAATGLSRSGYRWLLRDDQIGPFQKVMLPKVKEWLLQNTEYKKAPSLLDKFDDGLSRYTVKQNFDDVIGPDKGKIKKKFIAWYFDEAKKILKDKDIIEKVKKNITEVGDPRFDNDEVLLENYKIKGGWILYDPKTGYRDGDQKTLEMYRIKYCGELSNKEIPKIDVKKGRYPKCK